MAWLNLRHYSLGALWGVRLRLDPDTPTITRFFGEYIIDTVLEYRGYMLLFPWGMVLAAALPAELAWLLIALWAAAAFNRSKYFKSSYAFWEQAFKESPRKSRVRTRFVEALLADCQARDLRGESFESLAPRYELGKRIIDEICSGDPNLTKTGRQVRL